MVAPWSARWRWGPVIECPASARWRREGRLRRRRHPCRPPPLPLGRSVPIVLDPDRSFGEPALTSGAHTEAVTELVAAGEPRERVAAVYDISVEDLDAAVRYEHNRAA